MTGETRPKIMLKRSRRRWRSQRVSCARVSWTNSGITALLVDPVTRVLQKDFVKPGERIGDPLDGCTVPGGQLQHPRQRRLVGFHGEREPRPVRPRSLDEGNG